MTRSIDDFELDRKLAGGRPGGAEREVLWDRLSQTLQLPDVNAVPLAALSAKNGFWRRHRRSLVLGLAPALTAASVFVYFVVDQESKPGAVDPTPALVARGPAIDTPVLEATCGAGESPCALGERVGLRLHNAAQAGLVAVVLESASPPLPIVEPLFVDAGQTLSLTSYLVPELADLETGIRIGVYFLPSTAQSGMSPNGLSSPVTLGELVRHENVKMRTLLLKVTNQ
jgi:hypothetical protein